MYKYGRLLETNCGAKIFWTLDKHNDRNLKEDREFLTLGFTQIMDLLSKEGWDVVCSIPQDPTYAFREGYIMRKKIEEK